MQFLKTQKDPNRKPFDRYFFGIVVIILIIGVLSFISASLGVFNKNESKFYSVIFNQVFFGLLGGSIFLWITMRVPYTFWRKYAFLIFLGTLILTLLVFIPQIGFSHGGAKRWVSIGPLSFQPAEILKIGFIIYFSAWLTWIDKKTQEMKYKIIPFVIMIGIVALILLNQPDNKSLILIVASSFGMLFVSGVSWKKILGIAVIVTISITTLAFFRPYVMDRIKTFIDPSSDPRGASYQLQQSLIAIGSGGYFGRGLGQSVQKFSYLPEPQGDSVFAVFSEEFGFLGSSILIILYVFFAIRGYKIATRAPDRFSQYLVVGLVTLITAQVFMNILSMVGLFPLTGVPLVFISHGGTSLLIALASVGIILNVSRYEKKV